MQNEPSLCTDLIDDAVEIYQRKCDAPLNQNALSRSTGLPLSSLWFPLKGQRAWNADKWLKVLYALGALHYEGDHIIISSSALRKHSSFFSKIKTL